LPKERVLNRSGGRLLFHETDDKLPSRREREMSNTLKPSIRKKREKTAQACSTKKRSGARVIPSDCLVTSYCKEEKEGGKGNKILNDLLRATCITKQEYKKLGFWGWLVITRSTQGVSLIQRRPGGGKKRKGYR